MVITLFLILKTGTQNWTPYSKIELQPLNKDGFQTIEIPEDNEAKIATIGILKYIIR